MFDDQNVNPVMDPPAADPVSTTPEPTVPTPPPAPVVSPPPMPMYPPMPPMTPPAQPYTPPPLPVTPSVVEMPVAPVAFPAPPTVEPVLPVAPQAPVQSASDTLPAPADLPQTPALKEVFEGKGAGKYRVVIIKDKCIGAASCVAVAPQAFKLNDQQIAEVLPTIGQETDENLLLAAQSCPTLAIEVYDTETGEKVWPK